MPKPGILQVTVLTRNITSDTASHSNKVSTKKTHEPPPQFPSNQSPTPSDLALLLWFCACFLAHTSNRQQSRNHWDFTAHTVPGARRALHNGLMSLAKCSLLFHGDNFKSMDRWVVVGWVCWRIHTCRSMSTSAVGGGALPMQYTSDHAVLKCSKLLTIKLSVKQQDLWAKCHKC